MHTQEYSFKLIAVNEAKQRAASLPSTPILLGEWHSQQYTCTTSPMHSYIHACSDWHIGEMSLLQANLRKPPLYSSALSGTAATSPLLFSE
jgi:hypothetical protein